MPFLLLLTASDALVLLLGRAGHLLKLSIDFLYDLKRMSHFLLQVSLIILSVLRGRVPPSWLRGRTPKRGSPHILLLWGFLVRHGRGSRVEKCRRENLVDGLATVALLS